MYICNKEEQFHSPWVLTREGRLFPSSKKKVAITIVSKLAKDWDHRRGAGRLPLAHVHNIELCACVQRNFAVLAYFRSNNFTSKNVVYKWNGAISHWTNLLQSGKDWPTRFQFWEDHFGKFMVVRQGSFSVGSLSAWPITLRFLRNPLQSAKLFFKSIGTSLDHHF